MYKATIFKIDHNIVNKNKWLKNIKQIGNNTQ